MRVVVTGKGGQLALEFEDLKNGDVNWTFLDIHLLDITDELSVVKYFQNNPCDLIINCAAYTAVDLAEDNEEMAYKVNQIGVRNLLKVCSSMNAKFIHYSTDYVFDGTKSSPYVETDVPNPRSVYGASKLAGELEIQNSDVQSVIIRTAWVYSNHGQNFVKTMIRLGNERDELKVIGDQKGSPTNAADLAKDTLVIINDRRYQWKIADVFHYSNAGVCSWHDFAKEIFRTANIDIKTHKIKTEEYPTRAIRPMYSLLSKHKISQTFGLDIKNWELSLESMLKKEISKS